MAEFNRATPEQKAELFYNTDDIAVYLRSDELKRSKTAKLMFVDQEGGNQVELNFRRHINADGTVGGFVSEHSEVDTSTYIDATAVVCGRVTVSNSRIDANAAILTPDKKPLTGDIHPVSISNSIIGSAVKMKSGSAINIILVSNSVIGPGTAINIGEGAFIVTDSKIKDGVSVIADDFSPTRRIGAANDISATYKMLSINSSEIGSESTVILEGSGQRLRIVNMSIPSNSKVTVDPSKRYLKVEMESKLPKNVHYSVTIPNLEMDKVVSKFVSEAEDYAERYKLSDSVREAFFSSAGGSANKELESILLKAKYVYERIRFDDASEDFKEGERDIPLDYFIEEDKGVCFEKALLLYVILEKEMMNAKHGERTIKPYFVTGLMKSDDLSSMHAWVEVELEGEIFVIDPTVPYLYAGRREKNGDFMRFSPMSGWDYMRDYMPKVTPIKPNLPDIRSGRPRIG
jgi:hypothetical protein